MINFEEHGFIIVLIFIIVIISLLCSCATIIVYRIVRNINKSYEEMVERQIELQAMTKKFMDENEEFFVILDQFNDKFDLIIRRQGKLGGILGVFISEFKKHDKKVEYLLYKLGESVPNDYDQQNPGS